MQCGGEQPSKNPDKDKSGPPAS